MLILFVLEADFDVEDVEADDGIVDQSHETFDLLHDLVEELLVLVCHGCAGLVDLVETKIVTDGFRLLLDVGLQNFAEEIFQFHDGVVVHRGEVLPQRVYLHRVL